MTWNPLAIATERAADGGQREPSENPVTARAVTLSSEAPRWLSPRSPPGAVWPRPAARWLPAPRRARFASDYRAAVAPAGPASLSSLARQINEALALPRNSLQATVEPGHGQRRQGRHGEAGLAVGEVRFTKPQVRLVAPEQ